VKTALVAAILVVLAVFGVLASLAVPAAAKGPPQPRYDSTYEVAVENLRSVEGEERRLGVLQMVACKDDRADDALRQIALGTDPATAGIAAAAVAKRTGDPAAIRVQESWARTDASLVAGLPPESLERLLDSPSRSVRAAASAALGPQKKKRR
jgi:hypothetical protein